MTALGSPQRNVKAAILSATPLIKMMYIFKIQRRPPRTQLSRLFFHFKTQVGPPYKGGGGMHIDEHRSSAAGYFCVGSQNCRCQWSADQGGTGEEPGLICHGPSVSPNLTRDLEALCREAGRAGPFSSPVEAAGACCVAVAEDSCARQFPCADIEIMQSFSHCVREAEL